MLEAEDDETQKKMFSGGTQETSPLVSVSDMELLQTEYPDDTSIGGPTRGFRSPLQSTVRCMDEQGARPMSSNATDFSTQCSEIALASFDIARGPEATASAAPPAEDDMPEIFDVYCSPEKKPDPPDMTVEQYQQRQMSDINRAKEMVRRRFTNLTIIRLRDLGVAENECEQLANRIMDGLDVIINAGLDEPDQPEASAGDCQEFYRRWKEVESYQCLLIAASKSDDEEKKKQEMKNFCRQAFPSELFDEARLDNVISVRNVTSPEEIKTFIQDFFRRPNGIRAKRALHAMIIYFGHGADRQGYITAGGCMPLDDIIQFVKTERREALPKHPADLPATVTIIFCQCFAHQHSHVDCDRFKVVAFTTPNVPATHTFPQTQGYVNQEADKYAREHLTEDVRDTERWRRSDDSGFVNLGEAQTSTAAAGAENHSATSATTSSTHDEGEDGAHTSTA